MAKNIRRAWSAALAVGLLAPSNVAASPPNDPPSRSSQSRARDYPHPPLVKLVFDLDTVTPSLSDVNPGLVAIAELVRTYKTFGPDSPRLKVVVVLHGKTTDVALEQAAAARRNPGATNGSIDVMRSMVAQGVDFIVSREALANRKIAEGSVQSFVRFGPTAEIIFLDLEASGYIFDGSTSLGKD